VAIFPLGEPRELTTPLLYQLRGVVADTRDSYHLEFASSQTHAPCYRYSCPCET